MLRQTGVVDTRHLVLVFHVDHSSSIAGGGVPAQLTKYADKERYAPYQAECLKLATLRHYRESHRELEGTWDPMEGRSRIASTLKELCLRHGVQTATQGAHLVAAVRVSGLRSVVHVYHGPVVYDDCAGETLFKRIPEHARGLAAHFFKLATFQDQQEYRFVLSSQGDRPIEDEFYMEITLDLRRVFQNS